jgi:hypothetical protein
VYSEIATEKRALETTHTKGYEATVDCFALTWLNMQDSALPILILDFTMLLDEIIETELQSPSRSLSGLAKSQSPNWT